MEPDTISLLSNNDLPETVRAKIAEQVFGAEDRKAQRELDSQRLDSERRRFIWSTSFVAALAGLVTLSATFFFERISAKDDTENAITLEQVRNELHQSEDRLGQELESTSTENLARLEAEAREREFQYEIVRSELQKEGKTNAERAAVLLFLVRAGVLNALDREELAAMALEQQENPDRVIIPQLSAAAGGARLHVLAVGVGNYGAHSANLDLSFADDDAGDLASALLTSQQTLYSRVEPYVLRNAEATRIGILRALAAMRENMASGAGNDLVVVHFSGRSALVDDQFYLLPYDVDARDPAAIRGTALDAGNLQRAIGALAQHGRVILLIDACRSGTSTTAGDELATGNAHLAQLMGGANISVLTSSSADETSYELEEWRNGAFTQAVLEALTSRADIDGTE